MDSALAISPLAWPPTPSATTYSPSSSSHNQASSLCLRARPMSERPAEAYRTAPVYRETCGTRNTAAYLDTARVFADARGLMSSSYRVMVQFDAGRRVFIARVTETD